MVCFGVRARAEGAEGSLEWADPGIGVMTKSPAASALGKANMFLGRGDDKAMPAIHERLPNEVLHRETTAGVMDVEPHRPQVLRYESSERGGAGDLHRDGSNHQGEIS